MPAHDWRTLYPFASHSIDLDGHRYHYVDEGQGEVLLMVHGNPTWSFYWRNLVLAFRDRYRCLAVDHLGCGLSDKPQRYPYCLQRHTENLERLITQLGLENITLLAHDWGGAIGLGAAVRHTDRFARLVLCNTGAFPPPRVPRRIAACRFPVLGNFAMRGLNLFSRAALRMATNVPGGLPANVQAGLLAPYDNWPNRVGVARFVQDIPLVHSHKTYDVLVRLEESLDSLTHCPVLLVWGMRDWCFTPECLARFQSHFPHADSCLLDDAGHWVIEDAPEQVIRAVDQFLTRAVVESSAS